MSMPYTFQIISFLDETSPFVDLIGVCIRATGGWQIALQNENNDGKQRTI